MVVGMHAIPDELLELILLHVASPTCLVRSASVCKQWLSAGVYKDERWLSDTLPNIDPYLPKFVPSQQPPAVDERCFSLDFLPDSGAKPWAWKIQDSRGSLLLLDKQGGYYNRGFPFGRDMIVCEPATRRYQRIALRATFPDCALDVVECGYLADGKEGGGNGFLLNFRLVLLLNIYGYDHVRLRETPPRRRAHAGRWLMAKGVHRRAANELDGSHQGLCVPVRRRKHSGCP
ncbi:unnamed protein product [Urochloa decumbens]|uniref:F-box domain-containing protein n=1 Tax=Urochloa decumbens TaxID=240449 RepID=A0ABC9FHA9_9POAL